MDLASTATAATTTTTTYSGRGATSSLSPHHPVALAFAVAALQANNDAINGQQHGFYPMMTTPSIDETAAAAAVAAAAAAVAAMMPLNLNLNLGLTTCGGTILSTSPTPSSGNTAAENATMPLQENPQSATEIPSTAALGPSISTTSSLSGPEDRTAEAEHDYPDMATGVFENDDDPGHTEEDAEKRLARSRERNREHARRTRLRKKAHLEALQSKVKGLEAERQLLKQKMEECSIASILLGLSTGQQSENAESSTLNILESNKADPHSNKVALLAGGKRKRFLTDAIAATGKSAAMADIEKLTSTQPLKVCIDGRTTVIGGGSKSNINWKTGVYCNEDGVQKQLSATQLESLRRERNRMHAKMTRDRKKCFIATIEKTIEDLEADISRMRDILAKVAVIRSSQMVTPLTSPTLSSQKCPRTLDMVPSEDKSGQENEICSVYSDSVPQSQPDSDQRQAGPNEPQDTQRVRLEFALDR